MTRRWAIGLLVLGMLLVGAQSAVAVSFAPAPDSPLATQADPSSVVVGDFNGDGQPDLAVADWGESAVSVFLGQDVGRFGVASGYAVGHEPRALAIGDFNGDGKLDLAVANESDNTVSVLLGDGRGGFSAAPGSPAAVGNQPWAVAVGDFNGDGKADLAVANYADNSVSVLLGDGHGGFSAAPGSPVAVGSHPLSVMVGDFNGDGHPDLAVANSGDGTVSVLLGDGHGGFSAAPGSRIRVGGIPSSIAVGDFNRDGRTDLAVADEANDAVSVLLGDGSGGFSSAPGSPFAVGKTPVAITAVDLGHDGKLDLVVVNSQDFPHNDVSVLLGDGHGSFTPASGSPVAVGNGPSGVATGDFNGDGYPDLAVTNAADNAVSVLLNAPPRTTITGGPPGQTRATSATFGFQSDASPATYQCQLDGGDWAACSSPASYSGLSAGRHTFSVRSSNDAGVTDLNPPSWSWNIDLSSPPVASLTVTANPVLSSTPVTFDASGSHDALDGSIVDFRWDLGDGMFDHDTGSKPTITWTYPAPGIVHARVLVTNEVGTSAIATLDLDVRPIPPVGSVGVSINGGNYATNTPHVQLALVWPAFAAHALISNDGGFNQAGSTESVSLAPEIPWTLRTAGSARLPATVYVRFPDSSTPSETFTDDIVLDTTRPVVESAKLLAPRAATAATAARFRARTFRIRIRASDARSGIHAVQLRGTRWKIKTLILTSRKRRGIRKLSRILRITMLTRPHYIRVQSSGGTWSKWHRVL